ncbi:MAG: lactonase family protein [Bacteroidota bacterium]|nr:lactonase family protein [Bacteroidota bacterium]
MKKSLLIILISIVALSCQKSLNESNLPSALESSKNNKADKNNEKTNDILYVQTNDYRDNQNAILTYHHVGQGRLQHFGGPTYTRGSGVANPMQKLGPLDSDYELRVSADGRFLMAVNSGSNTIAVFAIQSNGKLEHVPGSPFPSGGQTPCSIDVSGNYVFIVNKSDDPLHPSTMKPNYSTFTIDGNGRLTFVSKFETTPGSSPTQNLVSRNRRFLFGDDFLGFMLMPPVGSLRSFTINGSGSLTPVPGTPYFIPALLPGKPAGGALGLWEHPTGTTLYVGFPLQGKVGVYGINAATGALSFQTAVDGGKAACWIRTTKDGSRMYVLNSGENTVSVYNTSTPSSPVMMQKFTLKNSGPLYIVPGAGELTTSEPFSLAFSTNEKILYIVNQYTNPDFSFSGNYNNIHYLDVSENGLLSEASEPVQIPVPNTVRPKGSVVISASKSLEESDDDDD